MTASGKPPYGSFMFLVDFGGGTAGGFQEMSGTGMDKAINVTLKHGVVGERALPDCLADLDGPNARCDVTVHRLDEHHAMLTWKLRRVHLVRCTSGSLHLKGNDVAIEELVLTCEGIETA